MVSISILQASPKATSPQVVAVLVWGMKLMPKSQPFTSFTVNDVPFSATEPLGAMNRASVSGARKVTRVLSPSTRSPTTCATPSTWPDTIWPPNSSPTFSARSRLIRIPSGQCVRPILVTPTVSAEICTSNQFCGSPSNTGPSATTVRHTPSQAIDAPISMPATS